MFFLGDCIGTSRLHTRVRTEQVSKLVCAMKCVKVVTCNCISGLSAHSDFRAIVLQERCFQDCLRKMGIKLVSVIQFEVSTNARHRDTLFVPVHTVIDSIMVTL